MLPLKLKTVLNPHLDGFKTKEKAILFVTIKKPDYHCKDRDVAIFTTFLQKISMKKLNQGLILVLSPSLVIY